MRFRVEKTCPVSKGLRQGAIEFCRLLDKVEKTCPVSKGLRLIYLECSQVRLGRKDLPCLKGIKTDHFAKVSREVIGRKDLPCLKGIKTNHCRFQ